MLTRTGPTHGRTGSRHGQVRAGESRLVVLTGAMLFGYGDTAGMPLILAATPIGDVDDAPPRLRRLITEADIITAEDTPRVRDLARRMGVEIGGVVRSHHEHHEVTNASEMVVGSADGKRGGSRTVAGDD